MANFIKTKQGPLVNLSTSGKGEYPDSKKIVFNLVYDKDGDIKLYESEDGERKALLVSDAYELFSYITEEQLSSLEFDEDGVWTVLDLLIAPTVQELAKAKKTTGLKFKS